MVRIPSLGRQAVEGGTSTRFIPPALKGSRAQSGSAVRPAARQGLRVARAHGTAWLVVTDRRARDRGSPSHHIDIEGAQDNGIPRPGTPSSPARKAKMRSSATTLDSDTVRLILLGPCSPLHDPAVIDGARRHAMTARKMPPGPNCERVWPRLTRPRQTSRNDSSARPDWVHSIWPLQRLIVG